MKSVFVCAILLFTSGCGAGGGLSGGTGGQDQGPPQITSQIRVYCGGFTDTEMQALLEDLAERKEQGVSRAEAFAALEQMCLGLDGEDLAACENCLPAIIEAVW